ncbi:MAG: phosphatidylglycerophosphatase A [Calditrichia bacterium]
MLKFLNYLIATALGAGYSPVAPGTAGSLLALLIIYFCAPLNDFFLIAVLILLLFLGVYSGTAVEREKGPDPSLVVIDEVVGMGISLLFLPADWRLFLVAFLFFRLFDIWKPPPVDQSQDLPGGWGIMMDDVLAGFYALICTHLLNRLLF